MTPSYWRKCGVCKKEIGFDTHYEICSVSTCRKSIFCSQDCFGVHVPHMKHRDAYPEDGHSPTLAEFLKSNAVGEPELTQPRRIIVSQSSIPSQAQPQPQSGELPYDVLIVASKLKDYVRAKSGLNTAQNVIEKLSDIVRQHVDIAVANAMNDGRKTLMDRDF